MTKSYDNHGAERLIPLLRVMNREISERSDAIRSAYRRINQVRRNRELPARERRIQEGFLQAEIATHKREVRLANKELARLGCLVDELDPSTVLIPGRDGDLGRGFIWRAGEARVEEVCPGE